MATRIRGTYYCGNWYENGLECRLTAYIFPHYNGLETNNHKLWNLELNLYPLALDIPAISGSNGQVKKDLMKFTEEHTWYFDTEEMFQEFNNDVDNGHVYPTEYYSQQWANKLIKRTHPSFPDCPCYAYSIVEKYLNDELEIYKEHLKQGETANA